MRARVILSAESIELDQKFINQILRRLGNIFRCWIKIKYILKMVSNSCSCVLVLLKNYKLRGILWKCIVWNLKLITWANETPKTPRWWRKIERRKINSIENGIRSIQNEYKYNTQTRINSLGLRTLPTWLFWSVLMNGQRKTSKLPTIYTRPNLFA